MFNEISSTLMLVAVYISLVSLFVAGIWIIVAGIQQTLFVRKYHTFDSEVVAVILAKIVGGTVVSLVMAAFFLACPYMN